MGKLDGLFHVELVRVQNKLNFEVRPNVSNGSWLMFLIPIAIILSAFKHSVELTPTYKLLPLFCIGLLSSSVYLIESLKREKYVKFYELWCFVPISLAYYFYLNKDFYFSIYSGLFCTFGYCKIYFSLLQNFPKSFTLGEAFITCQALTIFLYTTIPLTFYLKNQEISSVGASSTVIIQMEIFGIILLGIFLKIFKIKSSISFYFWTAVFATCFFLVPVHILLKKSPLVWVFGLLIQDIPTMKIILYWIICSCLAFFAVAHQKKIGKSTSLQRKIFHLLAAAVYIPGLVYECNLLYLGSGILLGIFFLLEMMRNLAIPPIGDLLQQSFMALSDEKDSGKIALTPIYLLCGFTLPLWLHPAPCDLTDSACFDFIPILSGILSVGIGDTFASVFGSCFGKHPYKNSRKTLEGTFGCILSQLITVYFLYEIGFILGMDLYLALKILAAIVTVSFIEAKTDQIDNVMLPTRKFGIGPENIFS